MIRAYYNGIDLPPLPSGAGINSAIFDAGNGLYMLLSTSSRLEARESEGNVIVFPYSSAWSMWLATTDKMNKHYLEWVYSSHSEEDPGGEYTHWRVDYPLVWCRDNIYNERGSIQYVASTPTIVRKAQEPIILQDIAGTYTYTQGQSTDVLTVQALVSDGGTLTYKWFKWKSDEVVSPDIPGADSPSYRPPSNEVGTWHYKCLVTNTWEGLSAWKYTSQANVIIEAAEAPDVPDIPDIPDVPDIPDIPDVPVVPDDTQEKLARLLEASLQMGIAVGLAAESWHNTVLPRYKYGGTVAPMLPWHDPTEYPYLYIRLQTSLLSKTIYLYLSPIPLMFDEYLVPAGAESVTVLQYYAGTSSKSWGTRYEYTIDASTKLSAPIWCNQDMYDASGNLYLEGSDPVPV